MVLGWRQIAAVAMAAAVATAAPAGAATLSEAEHAYVAANGPFTYCVDPDWPPFEVIDAQGRHQGIGADLLRLAAERAGIPLRLVPTTDWDETLALSRAGGCDILSFLNQSPKRDEWLVFTDPVFIDRNVIVAHERHPAVPDLARVVGETLALPRGTSIEERVRRDFPGITVVTTDSEAETFAMVSQGRADMAMRSLSVAVHTIKKDGWFNLKIAGEVEGYENRLRIGVRKDKPLLRDILNRGVAEISLAERAEIANRHVAIKVEGGIDRETILRIVAGFTLVLLTSLAWALKLRSVNKQLFAAARTDALTGLANRASLNEQMEQEWTRRRRTGRPFSVILLDVDHFKRINDELGHLTGDRVLAGLAGRVRATIRAGDLAGRWGGEEFLVLCPETDASQAATLAERLRLAVRRHDFGTGRTHTLSAGVAAMADGDSLDSLLQRTDEALYRAKAEGRDRVCLDQAPPDRKT